MSSRSKVASQLLVMAILTAMPLQSAFAECGDSFHSINPLGSKTCEQILEEGDSTGLLSNLCNRNDPVNIKVRETGCGTERALEGKWSFLRWLGEIFIRRQTQTQAPKVESNLQETRNGVKKIIGEAPKNSPKSGRKLKVLGVASQLTPTQVSEINKLINLFRVRQIRITDTIANRFFTYLANLLDSAGPKSEVIVDLNADGNADRVKTIQDGLRVDSFLGRAESSALQRVQIMRFAIPVKIGIEDKNEDLIPDLALFNASTGAKLGFYQGLGNGTFKTELTKEEMVLALDIQIKSNPSGLPVRIQFHTPGGINTFFEYKTDEPARSIATSRGTLTFSPTGVRLSGAGKIEGELFQAILTPGGAAQIGLEVTVRGGKVTKSVLGNPYNDGSYRWSPFVLRVKAPEAVSANWKSCGYSGMSLYGCTPQ